MVCEFACKLLYVCLPFPLPLLHSTTYTHFIASWVATLLPFFGLSCLLWRHRQWHSVAATDALFFLLSAYSTFPPKCALTSLSKHAWSSWNLTQCPERSQFVFDYFSVIWPTLYRVVFRSSKVSCNDQTIHYTTNGFAASTDLVTYILLLSGDGVFPAAGISCDPGGLFYGVSIPAWKYSPVVCYTSPTRIEFLFFTNSIQRVRSSWR